MALALLLPFTSNSPLEIVVHTMQSWPPTPANDPHADATILASGELDIQALECVMNLWEVIEQLEHGDMQQIHDKDGLQQGCVAHPMWQRIKVTINHCEHLHCQLVDPGEFDGDKEWFLGFFSVAHNKLTHSQKHKKDNENKLAQEMLPYWLIVEAVPHQDKEVFTLPHIFCVDLHGITQIPHGSTQTPHRFEIHPMNNFSSATACDSLHRSIQTTVYRHQFAHNFELLH
jgi:hypothetical protein